MVAGREAIPSYKTCWAMKEPPATSAPAAASLLKSADAAAAMVLGAMCRLCVSVCCWDGNDSCVVKGAVARVGCECGNALHERLRRSPFIFPLHLHGPTGEIELRTWDFKNRKVINNLERK